MAESKLLQKIGQKEADKKEIADKAIKKPELLSEVFEGLSADKACIKYGCAKILRIISEKEPEVLYPKVETGTIANGHYALGLKRTEGTVSSE